MAGRLLPLQPLSHRAIRALYGGAIMLSMVATFTLLSAAWASYWDRRL